MGHRKDVAGYVYGVATECAVKELMRASGMRPRPENERRDDPFYAHFPALKTLLTRLAQGRRQGDLEKLARDGAFMNQWDTDMRYAPKEDISDKQVEGWKADAERALLMMEGL
jgi:hypothetical protein